MGAASDGALQSHNTMSRSALMSCSLQGNGLLRGQAACLALNVPCLNTEVPGTACEIVDGVTGGGTIVDVDALIEIAGGLAVADDIAGDVSGGEYRSIGSLGWRRPAQHDAVRAGAGSAARR